MTPGRFATCNAALKGSSGGPGVYVGHEILTNGLCTIDVEGEHGRIAALPQLQKNVNRCQPAGSKATEGLYTKCGPSFVVG